MTWDDYYAVYMGMKLHFTGKGYDYTKYGPKGVKAETVKRYYMMLKAIAGKGETKEAFEMRLIAIFKHKIKFINDLYGAESEQWFEEYRDEISNWTYYLQRDVEYLVEEAQGRGLSFKEIFVTNNSMRLPFIAQMLERGKINYHSFVQLNQIIPFMDKISPMLFDIGKAERYSKLHSFNKQRIAAIVKPLMYDGYAHD